jgi:exopolysaccharide biosynthesis WecB/TagA/CpsF family protein
MAAPGKHNVCGIHVDAVEMEAAVERIIESARERRPLSVSALAVHGIMTGVGNGEHRGRLNELDMVVPDGQPVRWTLNLLHGTRLRERVYGPALMAELCAEAAKANIGIYLYGSTEEVLERLEQRLRDRFPTLPIAGRRASCFGVLNEAEQRALGAAIRESGAGLCFVGLGCPRQEVFCWAMRERIGIPVIAVGAAFDFHSGTAKEAPEWMQRRGLQWLHRLAMEPRRLWKRYLLLNPAYATLALAQLVGLWRPQHGPLGGAEGRLLPADQIPG